MVAPFLKRRKMNKKGNAVVDSITVIVIIFAFAVITVVGFKAFGELNDTIQQNDFLGNDSREISQDQYDNYPGLMDNLFFIAFILLCVFALVSSFMIDTHPIFFVFTIIMLIAVFVVAFFLANGYEDIMSTDMLSEEANEFTKINWIMTHLLELAIGLGFMVTLVLFIKYRQGV